ncbi:hypothetical protein DN824_14100 [Stutzerimonas nosocomialis]|uniref:cytochrome C oxidase subunit IV family protein n=1 Tax=Stutzerimonas nosocomialis TaxID=1056496 RepID=UPI001107B37A|nr:cytochrome C oxidase subunit IV family protein [Stutzerimonas nosocomialis]TLX56831.1 hypothetical protein DN824_14100 [Stutzerimonas nosocomialis]
MRMGRLSVFWIALIGLSLITVNLAEVAAAVPALGGLILLVALGKAWLITEGFMELRHAPRLWRGLMLAWPLLVGLGVFASLLAR